MLRNRTRDNSGATILLALLFFLLCALAGSVILSAGSAAAGRISGLKESEQSFYSITSAARVMRAEIEGQEFQAYTENDGPPVYTAEPDSQIRETLIDAIKEIYEGKKAQADASFTIYPSDLSQRDVLGQVTADFTMTDDYQITIVFRIKDSDQYVCRLTARAVADKGTSRYEEERDGKLVEIERKDIHVYWNECILDKG